jgi:hypothetical protein
MFHENSFVLHFIKLLPPTYSSRCFCYVKLIVLKDIDGEVLGWGVSGESGCGLK